MLRIVSRTVLHLLLSSRCPQGYHPAGSNFYANFFPLRVPSFVRNIILNPNPAWNASLGFGVAENSLSFQLLYLLSTPMGGFFFFLRILFLWEFSWDLVLWGSNIYSRVSVSIPFLFWIQRFNFCPSEDVKLWDSGLRRPRIPQGSHSSSWSHTLHSATRVVCSSFVCSTMHSKLFLYNMYPAFNRCW